MKMPTAYLITINKYSWKKPRFFAGLDRFGFCTKTYLLKNAYVEHSFDEAEEMAKVVQRKLPLAEVTLHTVRIKV